MSFDGVFIHHLVSELKASLQNVRINKVHSLDRLSFIFSLSNKKQLLISLNAESSHLRLTTKDFIPSIKTFPLLSILKKYLESSIILEINQYQNDRIVILKLESHNDLGYRQDLTLIIEFFGRNSNLFIIDENNTIIDCLKKSFVLSDNDKRILVPKTPYQFPPDNKENPFTALNFYESNQYQGVSNLLFTEITSQNNLKIITTPTKPQIILSNNKYYFYCFNLCHLGGEVRYFESLSTMLEEYYTKVKQQNIQNIDQKQIENYLKKEINKTQNKLTKQQNELTQAQDNLNLEEVGNLLSSNLYKVKKGDSKITVEDYYHNNQEITIPLNKELSPSKNLEAFFSKFKKAKRTISHLEEQIITTIDEIKYLETLLEQLKISKGADIKEILEELNISKEPPKSKKKQKPQITTFHDHEGNTIFVGKNNLQNNYLTHQLANKTDYFLHVKGAPGSHTILRSDNPTNDTLILAANIAGYYSKLRESSNVAVDYTLVRNVRKVPKTKGSFVTYTNYKTVFVTPDLEFIKKHTT